MAAILGLDDEAVRGLCLAVAEGQVVEAVNFNSPGQVVIAGDAAAVQRAIEAAKGAGAKRALPLPVSVPSHCSLMRGAAAQLAEVLENISLQMPHFPVVHNVTVAAATSVDEIRELLVKQLYSPVRWTETVLHLQQNGSKLLIEAGPGKVLAGLTKRISRDLEALPLYDPATLDKVMEAVNG
jgi:[acyl-carrier-protein] S-malonyltransferase